MQNESIKPLAQRLGRPPATLAAFGRLPPEQLAALEAAVEARIAETGKGLEAELSGLLPGPLGRWWLRWLRRGGR